MKARPVAPEGVRALRAAILRPGHEPEASIFEGDEDPDTLHVAILDDGEAVSVASVMREKHPLHGGPHDWRVRGMATAPELRGQGMGTVLLDALERHARQNGGRLLWCYARLPARALYARAGMRAEGDVFELEPIGPHLLMSKQLSREPSG